MFCLYSSSFCVPPSSYDLSLLMLFSMRIKKKNFHLLIVLVFLPIEKCYLCWNSVSHFNVIKNSFSSYISNVNVYQIWTEPVSCILLDPNAGGTLCNYVPESELRSNFLCLRNYLELTFFSDLHISRTLLIWLTAVCLYFMYMYVCVYVWGEHLRANFPVQQFSIL